MAVDVIVGLQRGDEGKGRFVDLVAGDYDIIARANGGANAGHTIVPEGFAPIALHQVPSGIAYPGKLNIIGGGVYLDPRRLRDEIAAIQTVGIKVDATNLAISNTVHMVFPHHIELDKIRESGEGGQGSTKSGIAFVASSKYLREGTRFEAGSDSKKLYEIAYEGLMRVGSVDAKEAEAAAKDFVAAIQELQPYMADTTTLINDQLDAGKRVLAEGAQAYWLDINHGMYPYVTSSATTTAGLLDGLGVAPGRLGKVMGVAKVVKSHVGGGPFVTEIKDEAIASRVRGEEGKVDSEYGATTGRARKVGYPDLVELRNAVRTNGVNELFLSKADHVSRFGDKVSVATTYELDGEIRKTAPSSAVDLERCKPVYIELATTSADISGMRNRQDLPAETEQLISLFEETLQTPVKRIGVGPERNQYVR